MGLQQSDTTRVIWNKDNSDSEQRFQVYLEQFRYLKDERYLHKREQLYLLINQGFSEKFVNHFFKEDSNISSTDLDLIRAIAFVCGEEYVLQTFYKKTFTLDEAREQIEQQVVKERFSSLPDTEEMIRANQQMKERFELQCDFLQKERETAEAHFKELLVKEREVHEQKEELSRIRAEREKEKNQEHLKTIQEENNRLNMQIGITEKKLLKYKKDAEQEQRRLLEKCSELKRQLIVQQDNTEDKMGWFQSFLNRKDILERKQKKAERNQFVMDVIMNPAYSEEQLKIIIHAVQEDVELTELIKMCNPKMTPENMKILEGYLIKQQEKKVSDV